MSSDAIAGLLGVLAGGAITFGVEWWRDRTRKRDEMRVAMLMLQAELSIQLAWLRGNDEKRRVLASNPARATALKCEAWMAHREVILRGLSALDTSTLIAHYVQVGDHDDANLAGRIEDNEQALTVATRWIANERGAPAPQRPHMFERRS